MEQLFLYLLDDDINYISGQQIRDSIFTLLEKSLTPTFTPEDFTTLFKTIHDFHTTDEFEIHHIRAENLTEEEKRIGTARFVTRWPLDLDRYNHTLRNSFTKTVMLGLAFYRVNFIPEFIRVCEQQNIEFTQPHYFQLLKFETILIGLWKREIISENDKHKEYCDFRDWFYAERYAYALED